MKLTSDPILLCGQSRDFDDDCACPDKAFLLVFAQNNMNLETDCACPDTAFGLATMAHSNDIVYVQTADTHRQSLPHSFHLALSPYAPGGPSVLNQAAWDRWQSFQQPRPLQHPIDHQLAEQALLQPIHGRFHPQHQTAETLTAWLHVTNACNLDCPYCYVRKSSARMSEEVGYQAVEKIFHTAKKTTFNELN